MNIVNFGKSNRMAKIFGDDGRVVMLALDHGYFMGPTTGMENPTKSLKPLLPHVDSLMLSPGILTTCVSPRYNGGIVLRASGGSSIISSDLANEGIILNCQEAVKLNASAIALSIFVGSNYEKQTLQNLSTAINEASPYNLPVLAVTAVGKELEKRDARYLAMCCRIAAEFGADIVKTYYCENFESVVSKCPAPIVVAGGPKLETDRDVLELCANSIQAGAAGVDMGRNIWQSKYPGVIVQAIKEIIHNNLTVDQGLEMIDDIKK